METIITHLSSLIIKEEIFLKEIKENKQDNNVYNNIIEHSEKMLITYKNKLKEYQEYFQIS